MPIQIIAEAGVNHNGSLVLAKQLALAAKTAGADIVKYQTFLPDRLASANARKAIYQQHHTGGGTQLEMLQKLSLGFDAFRELKSYCDSIGIRFLSTPFDLESITFLRQLGMPFWKVPSGEITNLPYLEEIGHGGEPVVLSTGMSTLTEVDAALDVLRRCGTSDITVLHCTTQYPTPYADVNLLAMDTLHHHTGLPTGYSDHTRGITVPIAAAARGACIIEKHFTLSRSMEGPDHKASLEPDELAAMVTAIRDVEVMLGDGIKAPRGVEVDNIAVARKSIVAATTIPEGTIITAEMLTTKRPGNGISPMRWYDVIGKIADRTYSPDELLDDSIL
jgi:N,N'-diacetyllegionaminate synthase